MSIKAGEISSSAYRLISEETTDLRNIIALPLIAALTGACSSSKKTFSEDSWHAEASSADAAKIYAPLFADGEFFNPWMPIKNKGALNVFEWKFSKKSNTYTAGDKCFMPAVIPEPGKRIRALGASEEGEVLCPARIEKVFS